MPLTLRDAASSYDTSKSERPLRTTDAIALAEDGRQFLVHDLDDHLAGVDVLVDLLNAPGGLGHVVGPSQDVVVTGPGGQRRLLQHLKDKDGGTFGSNISAPALVESLAASFR